MDGESYLFPFPLTLTVSFGDSLLSALSSQCFDIGTGVQIYKQASLGLGLWLVLTGEELEHIALLFSTIMPHENYPSPPWSSPERQMVPAICIHVCAQNVLMLL